MVGSGSPRWTAAKAAIRTVNAEAHDAGRRTVAEAPVDGALRGAQARHYLAAISHVGEGRCYQMLHETPAPMGRESRHPRQAPHGYGRMPGHRQFLGIHRRGGHHPARFVGAEGALEGEAQAVGILILLGQLCAKRRARDPPR